MSLETQNQYGGRVGKTKCTIYCKTNVPGSLYAITTMLIFYTKRSN